MKTLFHAASRHRSGVFFARWMTSPIHIRITCSMVVCLGWFFIVLQLKHSGTTAVATVTIPIAQRQPWCDFFCTLGRFQLFLLCLLYRIGTHTEFYCHYYFAFLPFETNDAFMLIFHEMNIRACRVSVCFFHYTRSHCWRLRHKWNLVLTWTESIVTRVFTPHTSYTLALPIAC